MAQSAVTRLLVALLESSKIGWKSRETMSFREISRWALTIGFWVLGAYCFSWFVQSASFSVPAQPIAKAMYETKAELLLPMSILFVAVGALFCISLRRSKN